MGDAKSFLCQWCQKNKAEISFVVRPTVPKHRQRFLCEVRISTFDYIGTGNSTNKKDAQMNGARDYVSYLVRRGIVNQADVPADAAPSIPYGNQQQNLTPQKPVFQDGMGPNKLGEAYRPYNDGGNRNAPWDYKDRMQQVKVEKAGDLYMNAGIHGNWTIENAKCKLHQFLQANKINADYKYTYVGPHHTKSFVAEMNFYVPKLGRIIYGRDSGSNKQSASKSCALSIVRQLYHLGVIEAFSGTLKKEKSGNKMKPYDVALDPDLVERVRDCLENLNITPPAFILEKADKPVSLVSNDVSDDFLASKSQAAGVVPWSPPTQNWNPWTGCNIYEGPLASLFGRGGPGGFRGGFVGGGFGGGGFRGGRGFGGDWNRGG